MKKLFTISIILLMSIAGYSQVKKVSKNDAKSKVATIQVTKGMECFENVQNEPNMTRTDGELDYTTYDWQTNAGPRNWTIQWPDGKVNFAFTCASDNSFSDRGTAIGTYDSNTDEWIPLGGRIESEKTDFGSIARYRDNGIVVVANTNTACGVYIVEDKDNMAPNSVAPNCYLDPTNEPYCPVVMTSGHEREIIHIIATGYDSKLYYFRSIDGGMTCDKENLILPYLTEEYGSNWSTNVAYWMETTEDNCLALVVNNPWSDGMVLFSYDDGETWERKVFYQHPGINTTFDYWFMYPRWVSCVRDDNGELRLAYEFNASTGEPGSDVYDPAVGGVAFWSESLPYHGNGLPFITDSEYIRELWESSPCFQDPPYQLWPEYFGYIGDLEGNQEFNIHDFSLHGDYHCGPVAMPVLLKVPGSDSDMVAVWTAIDENNMDSKGNFYFKLWASVSLDGGHTWWNKINLADDFMYQYNECVYPQAAIVGTTLIVVAQMDDETGTFVQSDDLDSSNNYYQGLTFDLYELIPIGPFGTTEEEHNTHITVYPNPAVDRLNVTLNKNTVMMVYNIMGQVVMNIEGHVGANNIDVSNLNSGIYFISAGGDAKKFVVK